MAPSIALWSSSMDDAVDNDTGPTPMPLATAGTSGKPTPPAPPKVSRPEWLGDDCIDDGQLAVARFWRGNQRFPEKELECAYLLPPTSAAASTTAATASPFFLRMEKVKGFLNLCCGWLLPLTTLFWFLLGIWESLS
uniref:Uncharacterized protein n=1 Tax=Zea mays TaxID=4577 RepID=C4J412_MAIZE|nr:unknown [Zea mays]ACR36026.1 unknown [Zea mays]